MRDFVTTLGVFLTVLSSPVTAEELDGRSMVDEMFSSLSPFSAVWQVELGWKANPGFAEVLESHHEEDLKGYGYKKGSEGEKALIKSLEKEAKMTRKGYVEKRTMRLDFYAWDRFYTRMDDPRWQQPEEVYTNGDGVKYTVSRVNETVLIEKLNRYDLGNLIQGVPTILLHSFSKEKQGFVFQGKAEMRALVSAGLEGSTRTVVSVEIDMKKSVITSYRYFSSFFSKKGELVEQPVVNVTFKGSVDLPEGKTQMPQIAKTERFFNSKSAMKSTWKLISLEALGSDAGTSEFKFSKGYSVYDNRPGKNKSYRSDDVLQEEAPE